MSLEEISMDPVKEKLSSLDKFLLRQPRTVYEFAKCLAKRLGPVATPAEFSLAVETELYSEEKGVDNSTKENIYGILAKRTREFYMGLRAMMPSIAEAVAPSKFAEEIKRIFEPHREAYIEMIKRRQ